MAQFDVHAGAAGLLLDCQSDMLSGLNTRLVVPLLPPDLAPTPGGRLNPTFEIDGGRYVMVTQYAGALEAREIGSKITSLAKHDREIIDALDVLITGV